MGQEFVIKSQQIEDKINQLLPSQGGFQAGVDFSASTTVIPIVDLKETAEGSALRQDLQTSFSLNSVTVSTAFNTTTTAINTTGYFRCFGNVYGSGGGDGVVKITDGTTTKNILFLTYNSSMNENYLFDFVVFLEAGDSLQIESTTTSIVVNLSSRQLADVNGNLTNP